MQVKSTRSRNWNRPAETMTTLTWQRSHGADIVAEVRTDERGLWWPTAWRRKYPDVVIRNNTGRPRRQAACARADALVRETFDHVCQVTTCGDWHRLQQ
jgi:hypothetical protein